MLELIIISKKRKASYAEQSAVGTPVQNKVLNGHKAEVNRTTDVSAIER